MSQSDMVIADQPGASFLADLNAALAALATNSSGATEPATTYAFQVWADTTADRLKIRNAANDAWVSVLVLSTGAPVSGVSAGPITASGLTQAPARLLGRSTAGAGAVEEIAVVSGLSLAGGFLAVKAAGIGASQLSGAQSGSAPVFGARAWCVFNGTTAGTNAPLAGGNVDSVTRNGVGDYTINFSIAMQDTNFGLQAIANTYGAGGKNVVSEYGPSSRAVGSIRIQVSSAGGASAASDSNVISVSVFR